MNNGFKIGESIIYLKNKRITGVIMQVAQCKVLIAYHSDAMSRTPDLEWVNTNEISKIV